MCGHPGPHLGEPVLSAPSFTIQELDEYQERPRAELAEIRERGDGPSGRALQEYYESLALK